MFLISVILKELILIFTIALRSVDCHALMEHLFKVTSQLEQTLALTVLSSDEVVKK